jgi:molybdate transport system substrate-binding protein
MKKLIILLSVLFVLPFSAFAEDLTVAAAANVQFTVEDLKKSFEQETGLKVKTIIGSSGKLTAQIENGAPFDIFLSADMDYPQTLYNEGLAYREPKVYAYGTLVLWTLKNNVDLSSGINVLADRSIKKVAIPNPKNAPYGRKAVDALKFSHLYQAVNKKLVYGESISQANEFIVAQAVDIGFTAKAIVMAQEMKDKGKWVEVNPQSYERIAQGAVITKYAQKHHLAVAEKFYDFLFSEKAQEIFKKYGYILP